MGRQFWEENQDLKKWGWKRISSRRELFTSLSLLIERGKCVLMAYQWIINQLVHGIMRFILGYNRHKKYRSTVSCK